MRAGLSPTAATAAAFVPPCARRAAAWHKSLARGYAALPLQSIPNMIHPLRREGKASAGIKLALRLAQHFTAMPLSISAIFRNYTKHTDGAARADAVTLEGLLSSACAPGHLVRSLWNIYRSNNLQISQSFTRLIKATAFSRTRRQSVTAILARTILASRMSARQTRILHTRIEELWRQETRTSRLTETTWKHEYVSLRDAAARIQPVLAKVFRQSTFAGFPVLARNAVLLHSHTAAAGPTVRQLATVRERTAALTQNRETRALLSRSWLLPILWKLHESIEAGTMLAPVGAYSSQRTLYRLTHSLWKIYGHQNLELSRSFSRLISTVVRESDKANERRETEVRFTSARSLHNLVSALRTAFTGGNLLLRQSLVSLVRNISRAGDSLERHPAKQTKITNMHTLSQPRFEGGQTVFRHREHRAENTREQRDRLERELERLVSEKIKSLAPSAHQPQRADIDSMYREFAERFTREQTRKWRLEKLSRGLM